MSSTEAVRRVSPEQAAASHEKGFRARRVRNWSFLGLLYAGYYLCRNNLGIVAPELKATFGFTNEQYGTIQTARAGAYAVGQFVNGLFTDKLGGKQAMTMGAVGTIVLNLLFGLTAWSNITWLFAAMVLIRLADGYVQAFGAPGMVKINTAWFRRKERGTFAGIFGAVINLGQSGVSLFGTLLATGASIPLIFFTITVPPMDWRYMFVVPPAILVILVIAMNGMVKNHPEEAGYRIVHDDEESHDDPHATVHIWDVFRRITSNSVVWIVAGAYFCTGFVRAAINDWWPIYFKETWHIEKDHQLFWWMGIVLLPVMATVGSMASGVISDKLFAGRRAPVAALLYLIQVVFIFGAIALSKGMLGATSTLAAVMILAVFTGCNATHSILGTAAAMDLGGRKMAGFAAGVIDSFQYFGAMLAGKGLGRLLDSYAILISNPHPPGAPVGAATAEAAVQAANTPPPPIVVMNSTVWFVSMLPWALVGTVLMSYLWLKHRGQNTRGA